jgi:hypothetical protein
MMTDLIQEMIPLLKKSGSPFWLAGGYSIDFFLNRRSRDHEDLDFTVKRSDQLHFQKALEGWDLQAANPPGSGELKPWPKGYSYDLPIHNIWCRKNESSPWDLELLFSEFENSEWVYRRNKNIRGPIEDFSWTYSDDLKILRPEIQLLYKSRSKRPKDLLDLQNCLPLFKVDQKKNLHDWIQTDSGSNHEWLKFF